MFLAIWIGVFIALTFYMFGFYMLPHDSENQRLSVGRVMVGVFSLIFTIYLIPGLWGAPLKLISGFPPPMSYSESPMGVGAGGTGNASFDHGPEGTHLGPQNLHAFHDYSKGLEYAKKVNKPLFVDFTGHACVNCRKMEENVWGESGVIEKLRDEVVVVSLYVDDKRALPKDEQVEVELAGKSKKLRTIGNKWSYLQARRYKTNTQPFYVMLTPKGKPLSNGSADYEHHGNATDFEQWLSSGINEFKSDYK
jgi:thiol:disulfide interchange protein DsbD